MTKQKQNSLQKDLTDFILIIAAWAAVAFFVTKCVRQPNNVIRQNQEKHQNIADSVKTLHTNSTAYFYNHQKTR